MTLTSTDLVLALDEVGPADAPRAGRKAATLGELRRAGFPVPDGVVLTTEAMALTLAAAGLDAGASPDQVAAVPLPGEVAAAIAAVAGRLGSGPLAVRSSGVDEDQPDALPAQKSGMAASHDLRAAQRCGLPVSGWAIALLTVFAPYFVRRFVRS